MNPRIFGAIIAGLIIVIAAYVQTRYFSADSEPSGTLTVADGAPLARTYIDTNDQDNDGVPDWRQALRTTEPLELDSIASSTYETPDTLTDQFAVDLFGQMIQSKRFGDFGDSPDALVAEANQTLVDQAGDTLFTESDINIRTDTSPTAARRYANQVAQISINNSIPASTPNEILILERAVQENNAAVLDELDPIIDSYNGMLSAMLATPVPANLTKEHLDLINTYQAIASGLEAFETAFDDPLRALVRLQRYREDASGLYYAYTGVFAAAHEAGARFEKGVDVTLEVVAIDDTDN